MAKLYAIRKPGKGYWTGKGFSNASIVTMRTFKSKAKAEKAAKRLGGTVATFGS